MSDTNVQAFPGNEDEAEKQDSGDAGTANVGGVSGERLKSFIERIERLEEEKSAIADDIKDVYSEAKATGFEPKIMRKIVSLRKMDTEKRREENELIDIYKSAIGMGE